MRNLTEKPKPILAEAWAFTRARFSEIAWGYAPVYGEILVIGLEYWCWFVLAVQPNYLYSGARLIALADRMPQSVWQTIFLWCAIYKTVMLVFGSHAEITIKTKTYLNPFMRTSSAVKVWYSLRYFGLFVGVPLHLFVMSLLSNNGLSWGMGFFFVNAVLCTIGMVYVAPLLWVEMHAPKIRSKHLVIRKLEVG